MCALTENPFSEMKVSEMALNQHVKHTVYLDKETNQRVIDYLRTLFPDKMTLPFNAWVVNLIQLKLEEEGY